MTGKKQSTGNGIEDRIRKMSDRELLVAFLRNSNLGFREHAGEELVMRNGRWGTCVMCPRRHDGVHPEECSSTDRQDHNIHSTLNGKFFYYGREIARSELLEAVRATLRSA